MFAAHSVQHSVQISWSRKNKQKTACVFRANSKLKVNLSCILKDTVHGGFMPAMQVANNIEWLDLCRDFTHVTLFDQ